MQRMKEELDNSLLKRAIKNRYYIKISLEKKFKTKAKLLFKLACNCLKTLPENEENRSIIENLKNLKEDIKNIFSNCNDMVLKFETAEDRAAEIVLNDLFTEEDFEDIFILLLTSLVGTLRLCRVLDDETLTLEETRINISIAEATRKFKNNLSAEQQEMLIKAGYSSDLETR